MYHVYVYRGGQIRISDIDEPEGTVTIRIGGARDYECLLDALHATARAAYAKITSPSEWGYHGWVLLVPGVPEALSSEEAFEAVMQYVAELRQRTEER